MTAIHKNRDWTQLKIEAHLMNQAGSTRVEISETLGVSVNWLRKILGPSQQWRGPRPGREREQRMVRDLHWQGLTLGQIRVRTGIPKSTIHDWVR